MIENFTKPDLTFPLNRKLEDTLAEKDVDRVLYGRDFILEIIETNIQIFYRDAPRKVRLFATYNLIRKKYLPDAKHILNNLDEFCFDHGLENTLAKKRKRK